MRLIRSSVPGAVERDKAVRLLTERAVLTRMVCRELRDADIDSFDRRPRTALSFLLRWIHENMPDSVHVEPHSADGIDQMIVPDGYQDILEEIRAGAQVAEALFMLETADNSLQADGDRAIIRERLTAYWAKHPAPVAMK